MTSSFDLNLLPLARDAGKDLPELAGLFIAPPPRRPARGRQGDQLVLYLSLAGNAPMPPVRLQELLGKLAPTYYETPGSVTAALRAVVEALNTFLMTRNQRGAPSGKQTIGLFSQVAMHGDRLYLAQSGQTHAYLLQAQGVQHLYEPLLSGNGLGLSRLAQARYSQLDLQPGDTLLLSALPDERWSAENLSGLHGQGPESLRRRLVPPGLLNLSAVLVQARPGQGKVTILHTSGVAEPAAPTVPASSTVPAPGGVSVEVAPPAPAVEAKAPAGVPAPQQSNAAPPPPAIWAVAPDASPEVAPGLVTLPGPEQAPPWEAPKQQEIPAAPEPVTVQAAPWSSPAHPPPTAEEKPAPRKPRPGLGNFWRLLVRIGTPFARAGQSFGHGVRSLLARMLPLDPTPAVPASTMAFIAVAIPIIVVAIGSTVYLQLGRNAQYGNYYSQALEVAEQAQVNPEPSVKRADWETVVALLDRAELYQVTADSLALRQRARSALDELDLVRRLEYRQAIVGGLEDSRQITQLGVINGDLYLLDAPSGQVLRAVRTGRGYELDNDFRCGPVEDQVGPLVDFVRWPPSYEPGAALLAMDATGVLLFCQVGQAPNVSRLAAPPTSSYAALPAFVLDQGYVYLVDPQGRAVWVYWNEDFDQTPRFFFGDEVPEIGDVVDLVVNGDELYLLHATGYVTICFGNNLTVAQLRCSDTPYVDYRPGLENTPLTLANPFTQVSFNPPPDPSLLFLEPQSQGVYHFSLRTMGFLREYLPATPLPGGPASTFALDSLERILFVAAANEVYYANLP